MSQSLSGHLAPLSWDALIAGIAQDLPRIWDAWCPDDGRPAALLAALLTFQDVQGNFALLDMITARIRAEDSRHMAGIAGKRTTGATTDTVLTSLAAYHVADALIWAAGGIVWHCLAVNPPQKEQCRAAAQEALYTARITAGIAGNGPPEDRAAL